jgi:hypothetical protein
MNTPADCLIKKWPVLNKTASSTDWPKTNQHSACYETHSTTNYFTNQFTFSDMKKLAFTLLLLLVGLVASVSAQTARVQVIHNSPDPTVDVYAGPTILLDDFAFRTASSFVDVPAGIPIPIGVAPSTSTSAAEAIFTQNVVFEAGQTYVVTASGVVFNTTTPFQLIAQPNAREAAAASNKVELAILHGGIDAPAVDIAVRTGTNLVSNISYGQFSPYLTVDPNLYYLDVKPAGSNQIVQTYKADLSPLNGQAVYVFASGYLTPGAGVPFGLFAALADGTVVELPAEPVARVQFIHNSPSPTVDVYIDGELAKNDVAFRQAKPFIYLSAGTHTFAVAPDTSTSVASAIATFGNLNFENGKTYIITAQGIVGDATAPFLLNIDPNGRESASASNKVALALIHGSPNAPAVDVALHGTMTNLFSNVAYNETRPYIEVDPGIYYLDVKPAGGTTPVATYKADLTALGGKAAYVLASGNLFGTPAFGVYVALTDGTVVQLPEGLPPVATTARLQVIHNSPSPTVDVYVNGDLFLNDFAFRDATPFQDVPGDTPLAIGVALSNSTSVNDTLVNFDVTLAGGQTYIVVASGIVGNAATPFTLSVNPTGQEAATNPAKVDVAVLHGSPNAHNVDVDEFFGGNILGNLAYGEFTPYLSLDPGIYDLSIRPAGSPTVIVTYRADLSGLAGGAAYLFASGLVGGTGGNAFGLYAALPDGTVLELPGTPTTRVQVIHNAPSPTVDVYAGNRLLIDNFAYLTATPFVDLPSGRQFTLGIAPELSLSAADAIATVPATLEANKAYTVMAAGVLGGSPGFDLFIADDARESAAVGLTAVSVFHGAPDAPTVDVAERLAGILVTDLSFGEYTPYLDLASDAYFLDVKPAGSDQIVQTYLADLSALNGQAIRVMASGFLAGSPGFGLYAVLTDGTVVELPASPVARVQVIHNSPSPTVDVYAGNDIFIEDFEYRTATEFIYVPAGIEIPLGVAPGDSQGPADIIATFPTTFDNGKTYVVVASGIVGDATTPFTLFATDAARERSTDNAVLQLMVMHGGTDAPAVDVADAFTNTEVITNLAYGQFTNYLDIAPEFILLDVKPAGTSEAVVGTWGGDFTGGEGLAGVVFATGKLSDPAGPEFDLWLALPNGFTLPIPAFNRVQVIHNAPDPAVDVYYQDGTVDVPLLEGFEFRTATEIGFFPARTPFSLAVAPASSNSSDDAIYTYFSEGLEVGKNYILMAHGVVGSATTPLEITALDAARFRSNGGSASTDLVLFHGAPDAPEVDITLAATGTPIFNDVAYGEFSDYISVPPASYIVNVTPANDNSAVVAAYIADILGTGGQAITLFASGFLQPAAGQPGFGAWAALTDGTTFPLPPFVSTNELDRTLSDLTLAPNPVADELTVRFALTQAEQLRYRVRDVAGRLVLEGDFGQVPSGEFAQRIGVSELNSGLFMLEIVSDAGAQTTRFVVQR